MNAGIAVQSRCGGCSRGEPHGQRFRGRIYHSVYGPDGKAMPGVIKLCLNFDEEHRHIAEPLGYYRFAWLPVRCRNGRWRWLTWIEDHGNGTYSLGDRAH